MNRDWMPLAEVIELGDRVLALHFEECRQKAIDPRSKGAFWQALAKLEEVMPVDAAAISVRAATTYVSAALGHERKRRPRMLVWKDGQGNLRFTPPPWDGPAPNRVPPLDEMLISTVEDELREHGIKEQEDFEPEPELALV